MLISQGKISWSAEIKLESLRRDTRNQIQIKKIITSCSFQVNTQKTLLIYMSENIIAFSPVSKGIYRSCVISPKYAQYEQDNLGHFSLRWSSMERESIKEASAWKSTSKKLKHTENFMNLHAFQHGGGERVAIISIHTAQIFTNKFVNVIA